MSNTKIVCDPGQRVPPGGCQPPGLFLQLLLGPSARGPSNGLAGESFGLDRQGPQCDISNGLVKTTVSYLADGKNRQAGMNMGS